MAKDDIIKKIIGAMNERVFSSDVVTAIENTIPEFIDSRLSIGYSLLKDGTFTIDEPREDIEFKNFNLNELTLDQLKAIWKKIKSLI